MKKTKIELSKKSIKRMKKLATEVKNKIQILEGILSNIEKKK